MSGRAFPALLLCIVGCGAVDTEVGANLRTRVVDAGEGAAVDADAGCGREAYGFARLPNDWSVNSESYDVSSSTFRPEGLSFASSALTLSLGERADSAPASKPYYGGGLHSPEVFGYGTYRAQLRIVNLPSAAVFSFFLTHDIEQGWVGPAFAFYGETDRARCIYSDPAVARWTDRFVDLGFNAGDSVRELAIELAPSIVRYRLDGRLLHEWTDARVVDGAPRWAIAFTLWSQKDIPIDSAVLPARVIVEQTSFEPRCE